MWCHCRSTQNMPRHIGTWAIVLHQQGKLDEALKHYKEAIRIDPNYADAHNKHGCYPRSRKVTYRGHFSATPRPSRSTQNMPWHIRTWAELLHDQGKLNEALKHYKEAIRIDPNSCWCPQRHGCYPRSRRVTYSEALQCYAKAIQINPEHALAHKNMGRASAWPRQAEWGPETLQRSHPHWSQLCWCPQRHGW